MNSRLPRLPVWVAFAGGVLVLFAVPDGSPVGELLAPCLASHWARFGAFAAVAAVPCFAWRFRTWAFCSAALAFAVLCALPNVLFHWPPASQEMAVSALFGIAAGILLGLNLRFLRHPAGAVPIPGQDRAVLSKSIAVRRYQKRAASLAHAVREEES